MVRPFSAVSDLLKRVREAGVKIAIGTSAKKDELGRYLDIARIADLVDVTASSEDAEKSKPAPDIFEVVLKKLKIEGRDAVAIGDTPYDVLQLLILLREITVNYMAPLQARFLVRRGSTDWMVYDRERKGAAQLKDYSLAEKLTKEQAEQIKQRLATGSCQPT
nr:HAD hydrolase-like protein [Bradyrhizobium sp. th.b2]